MTRSAQLHDGFFDHPKVAGLMCDAEHPMTAVGLWTIGLSWAYKYAGPDYPKPAGFIPTTMLTAWTRSWRADAFEAAKALADAGLWDDVPGGYLIHDFSDWSPAE